MISVGDLQMLLFILLMINIVVMIAGVLYVQSTRKERSAYILMGYWILSTVLFFIWIVLQREALEPMSVVLIMEVILTGVMLTGIRDI